MEKTGVAIVGMGTVGTGVARLLLDHGDRTARHAGRVLWLEKAVVRDLKKSRGLDLPAGILTDSVEEVINNPNIKVVAQLIGGLEQPGRLLCGYLNLARISSRPTKRCWPNMAPSCSIRLAVWDDRSL